MRPELKYGIGFWNKRPCTESNNLAKQVNRNTAGYSRNMVNVGLPFPLFASTMSPNCTD